MRDIDYRNGSKMSMDEKKRLAKAFQLWIDKTCRNVGANEEQGISTDGIEKLILLEIYKAVCLKENRDDDCDNGNCNANSSNNKRDNA